MARYLIKFSKQGYIKYTSHLDMLRLFKRSFKKTEVTLKYSHGFNPHPKMSFAQPLSLGYSALEEVLEFETKEDFEPSAVSAKMQAVMPEGIKINTCERLAEEGKTLAARTFMADYKITIPCRNPAVLDGEAGLAAGFLAQPDIIVMKPQKKSKIKKPLDIKNMIKGLDLEIVDDKIIMYTSLDSGSNSNLSPELLIAAFLEFSGIECERHEIEVERIKIYF